jgi:hypothetical protein
MPKRQSAREVLLQLREHTKRSMTKLEKIENSKDFGELNHRQQRIIFKMRRALWSRSMNLGEKLKLFPEPERPAEQGSRPSSGKPSVTG